MNAVLGREMAGKHRPAFPRPVHHHPPEPCLIQITPEPQDPRKRAQVDRFPQGEDPRHPQPIPAEFGPCFASLCPCDSDRVANGFYNSGKLKPEKSDQVCMACS